MVYTARGQVLDTCDNHRGAMSPQVQDRTQCGFADHLFRCKSRLAPLMEVGAGCVGH